MTVCISGSRVTSSRHSSRSAPISRALFIVSSTRSVSSTITDTQICPTILFLYVDSRLVVTRHDWMSRDAARISPKIFLMAPQARGPLFSCASRRKMACSLFKSRGSFPVWVLRAAISWTKNMRSLSNRRISSSKSSIFWRRSCSSDLSLLISFIFPKWSPRLYDQNVAPVTQSPPVLHCLFPSSPPSEARLRV